MQASRINPAISTYEALNRPYDWNQYPTTSGCKAVIYEDSNTRGLWALQGVNGWYLGPSMDHYRCKFYYISETQAYRILGSTELLPQHCQVPNMTPHQHFCALTNKLAKSTAIASATNKGRRLIKLLQSKIKDILHPPASANTPQAKQRVREEEQRVIDETPILTILRIRNAPPIMQVQNPTAKIVLENTPWLHWRLTQNNTPRSIPLIRRFHPIPNSVMPEHLPMMVIPPPHHQRLLRTQTKATTSPTMRRALPSQATQRIVTQQAINVLTIKEKATLNAMFTPCNLIQHAVIPFTHHFKHKTKPMVHLATGETISNYKTLMHYPATAEIWRSAFGKDFGGMAQSNYKMGKKGKNAMFVMTHEEIQGTSW
jgi:hypothetical protein